MEPKHFVVCECAWEDDGDGNFCSRAAGYPVATYFIQANAAADARERNLKDWRDQFVNQKWHAYVDDTQWVNAADDLEALFKLFSLFDVKVTDESFIEYTLPAEPLPRIFFERLSALCMIEWFDVREVPAGTEDVKGVWCLAFVDGTSHEFWEGSSSARPLETIPEFSHGDVWVIDARGRTDLPFPRDPVEHSFVLIPKTAVLDVFFTESPHGK